MRAIYVSPLYPWVGGNILVICKYVKISTNLLFLLPIMRVLGMKSLSGTLPCTVCNYSRPASWSSSPLTRITPKLGR